MRDERTVVNLEQHYEPTPDTATESVEAAIPDSMEGTRQDASAPAAAAASPTKRPVPPLAKYALAGLVCVAAAAFMYNLAGFTGGFTASDEPKPWQIADSAFKGAVESRLQQVTDSLTSAFKASDQATEARLAAALAKTQAGIAADTTLLAQRVDALDASLTALNQRIDSQQSAIVEIKALVAGRETDIALIRGEVDRAVRQYDRKWTELAADTGGGTASAAAPARTPLDLASLPFQVVSMDLWDGKPQLAVREGDRWRFLRVGDTLRGWTVASADYAAATVGLRNANNELYMLTLPNNDTGVIVRAPQAPPKPAGSLPTLTVLVAPENATIKVMNIGPKYRPNMALRPGAYDILVRQKGYETYRRWIRLGPTDRVLRVTLRRK